MKMSEMTARQKKAFINIYHASNHLLGGLENTISDNSPGTPEHENAKAMLADHDALVRELYSMATTAVYAEGLCGFGLGYQLFIREINFCGKEWLMERCEKRITKEGY